LKSSSTFLTGRSPPSQKHDDHSGLSHAKDRQAAARRACDLRAEGMTLKEIGVRLAMEGFQRDSGRAWYPSLVAGLLGSAPDVEESPNPSP